MAFYHYSASISAVHNTIPVWTTEGRHYEFPPVTQMEKVQALHNVSAYYVAYLQQTEICT